MYIFVVEVFCCIIRKLFAVSYPTHQLNKQHLCLQASWTGIPQKLRPVCWRLLLGYEPPNRERAAATVKRKRREYQELVPAYFDVDNVDRDEDELAEIKQA